MLQTMMNVASGKPALKSLTVWGSVATVVVAVGSIFGWEIEQATVTEVLSAGAVVVTGLITIWGRIRAKKEINGVVK